MSRASSISTRSARSGNPVARLTPLSLLLLSLLTLAATVGCGRGGASQGGAVVGQPVGPLGIVSLAEPAQSLPLLPGRVTLLNFWGTWCPPCRRELPGLVRLATRLRKEPAFQLLAVSCGAAGPDDLDEITATTRAFLKQQKLSLEAWADPDGFTRVLFSERFGLEAFPTTYLIGPDARVRAVWTGYRSRDEADIARAVVEALKEVPAAQASAAPAGR